jgi:hypothetical protein
MNDFVSCLSLLEIFRNLLSRSAGLGLSSYLRMESADSARMALSPENGLLAAHVLHPEKQGMLSALVR